MTSLTFSVEVITLPVSDVDRALRFYRDQLSFRLDVTIRGTTPFASCSLLRRAPPAPSRLVRDSRTHPSVHSAMSILWSATLMPRALNYSSAALRSARSVTRRPSELGREVSRLGLIPRAATMPASPASPIRMAIAGCCKNAATATSDIVGISCEIRSTRDFHAPWLNFFQ